MWGKPTRKIRQEEMPGIQILKPEGQECPSSPDTGFYLYLWRHYAKDSGVCRHGVYGEWAGFGAGEGASSGSVK